ncbi:hypothetical protein PtrSN002B_009191 [Pyrenophora tritici-repentis]|uniref:Uncharacterized protein n=2 Tax=Pyrenophora tritici-repentis TaxID=45151 RepID=A0A2W1D7J1_9PLEO|nr:uncharacterized protein PTRG_03161 [Pyrenophora tritici-repentis Pt-1C-BFP]KAA8622745.1 hypothetical protein PtrV1_04051 [Pyrenophora tritici-repentis]EDU45684.1 predicted protein [Pyrenophora tritici-repentis Pt-1C-BFP]KAF7451729.1 hypothetical protein A1F99_035060 [Pyrenophora tritici-repentis]KAF7575154.1 hypothetical protein PtrM4_067780 [Pyrenophora tritici-repentis]KAG9386086.1 hypothetical protein A1F94_002836 [Pyrenophora tritici-repentis]
MPLKYTSLPLPPNSISYTHPLNPILPTLTTHILNYQNQVIFFSSHLSAAQPAIDSLPAHDNRKIGHERLTPLLGYAKARLKHLVDTTTSVVEMQAEKPNRALTNEAERANAEIGRELVGIGEVLDEMWDLIISEKWGEEELGTAEEFD